MSKFLLVCTLILFLLSLFTGLRSFYFLALAGLVYSYFRMFSRNYAARQNENRIFLDKTAKLRRFCRIQKRRFSERGEFRYFKCPGCGQDVRVPKGKGHIMITCPKCRTQFDKTV